MNATQVILLICVIITIAAASGGVRLFILMEHLQQRQTVLEHEISALREIQTALTDHDHDFSLLRQESTETGLTPDTPDTPDDPNPDVQIEPQETKAVFNAANWNRVVKVVQRRGTNEALRVVSTNRLLDVLGAPGENLTQKCGPVSAQLAANLYTGSAGPFRVRMLRPAVSSLKQILKNVRRDYPTLFDSLGTAGSVCVRQTRWGTTPSRHSFGIAVDITINGETDPPKDQLTQLGLSILSDYFFEAGWYWGASFKNEDSMHFEVGRELFESWVENGIIGR